MFTGDGYTILQFIINKTWQFFQVTVPGTNITFSTLFISIILTCFTIKLVTILFGLIPNTGDSLTVIRKNRERNNNK